MTSVRFLSVLYRIVVTKVQVVELIPYKPTARQGVIPAAPFTVSDSGALNQVNLLSVQPERVPPGLF